MKPNESILHGIINFNRVLNTALLGIVAYFLIDLHSDFKTLKIQVQTLEVTTSIHSVQLAEIKTSFPNLIQKQNQPHEKEN